MSMLITAGSSLEALLKRTAYLNEIVSTSQEIPGPYADDIELRVPEIESL